MSHIFVSYSRSDIIFASKIVQALADNQLDTWIDWKSIPKGEDWEQEIYRGIEEADAFLFLISPDSVASQMCNKEIAHAVKNGKRILPIVIRDADLKSIHLEISKRNWIFCRTGQDDFNKSIEETHKAIHTDYEWLKYHTKLQVKALDWERGKDASRLLWGKELREADELIGAAGGQEDPQPTDMQRQYILASKRSEERQRQRITLGLGIGLVIVTGLAIFAWGQRNSAVASESTAIAEANAKATALVGQQVAVEDAQTQRAIAVENLSVAQTQESIAKQNEAIAKQKEEEAKKQALIALSEKLSTLALSQVDSNYTEALLLGVESVRILEVNNSDLGYQSDILPTLLQKTQSGLRGTLSRPPYGIVRKIVYEKNGLLMASASDGVDLWDTTKPDSPKLLKSWPGKSSSDVVFSADSTMLVAGFQDGSVGFYDVKSLREIGSFEVYPLSKVNIRVAIKSDGKILAVAGNGKLSIWDISNLTKPEKLYESLVPHKGLNITDLYFHPTIANYLISAGEDNYFRVWDLQYPRNLVLQSTVERNFGTTGGTIIPDLNANFVLVGGYYLDFYDAAFRPVKQFYYKDYVNAPIYSVVTNASGQKLYTADGDGVISEWAIGNLLDIKKLREFSGHTDRINSMAIHPNGKIIVSGGNDSKIFYWSITDDPQLALWTKKIPSKAGINDISYSTKYNYLAIGEGDTSITLWDIANPASWLKKSSFEQPPVQITFSPSQDRLAVLAYKQGNLDSSVSTLNIKKLTYSEKKWWFDLNSVDYFAFGENYVLAGEYIDDSPISIYPWNISNPLVPLKGQKISVTTCPSLDSAYASNIDLAAVISCTIQLWDFSGNKIPVLRQSEKLDAINSPRSIAFHPNGNILAVGTGDDNNSIQFWSVMVKDGKIDAALINKIRDPHLRPVTSVAFSADGNMLASGSNDQSVALWDITNLQSPKYRFSLKGHSGPLLNGGVFFSQDGKTLISATKTEVILWNLDQDFWLEKACKIAGRNFNQQEWLDFIGDEPYHVTCRDFPAPEE